MTYTLTLPTWGELGAISRPLPFLILIATWYLLAGLVIRLIFRGPRQIDTSSRVDLWMASPFVMVFITICVLMWAVSFGCVPAPWTVMAQKFRNQHKEDDS